MKKFLAVIICIFLGGMSFAETPWINDLRNLFLSNNAIIYAVNIRTFNAQDTNKNGIIDEDEESGNFLNAIGRLDEIQAMGINTLHILPIMELGVKNALGTAGSLYAPRSFNKLNNQLKSRRSMLSTEEQAIKFINEAHKRNLRIIIDLPACGSYDLSQSNSELFLKDANQNLITPQDWKDVKVLNGGNDQDINQNVLKLYKDFTDYVIMLGADGIRADVASSKPAAFWKELIEYSRKKDPQFLWLAEAYTDDKEPIAKEVVFTPYDKLLVAGFDGFYDGYPAMKDWRKASQLMNNIKFTNSFKTKFTEPKAVIGSFSTHDELSPVLINGIQYSDMILWLNSTLPLNAYYVDGFPTGDNYVYFWGNKKAYSSLTDDNTYFVHRGKLDIFNFSRKPGGQYDNFKDEFSTANSFKNFIAPIITNGKYTELKTSDEYVFAYGLSHNNTTVLVFGNMDFRNEKEATIKVPHFKTEMMVIPIKLKDAPKSDYGKFNAKLNKGEIQVLLINNFEL